MREIEGIDKAMAVLKPHWEEIEDDFHRHNARFLQLASTDHDAIGRVLRSHLVVENFMNSYLTEFFGIEDFDELRLTFAQKAKMLPAGKSSASFVRPGIIQLNKVRNKFGHQLNHAVEFQEINSIMQILGIARSETNFTTPMDAIEAFAAIACAFLSIPPKHLQGAFIEAFKHVHTEMPD
ncbi:hypothetical protein GYN07_04915 [Rhizobium leguminosarum bv. viciae 248]|uniref:hypothetical protein n=1 Tax=Rhizobium TaxID=379 RepID=UPI00036F9638|nr:MULTISPECIES: hypothetical protein [Rhizobium]MCA2407501.1 hypothetical protein [Rhizobium leguminosarum]NEJ16383.1 hypothetical protein [Rhizobium ruizarguesonis]NEK30304.1 hypothetical protein [Rhizobium ruizarguesonis]NKL02869.1 hypothetical protein [Rhizobium leguminosarum bv. viciae]NKM62755.1 hypothetical protein [Rhizobium leguminosarum bv. viciae]